MGIDGVVVDYVQDIAEAISDLLKRVLVIRDVSSAAEGILPSKAKPKLSQKELSFLLKLIPELIKQ